MSSEKFGALIKKVRVAIVLPGYFDKHPIRIISINTHASYSGLPISNPWVINRTEVEVPYLGD